MKTLLLAGEITDFLNELFSIIDIEDIFSLIFFIVVMVGIVSSSSKKKKQQQMKYQTTYVPKEMKRQNVQVDLTSKRKSAPRQKSKGAEKKGIFAQIAQSIQAGIEEANAEANKKKASLYKPNQKVQVDVTNHQISDEQQDLYEERNQAYEVRKRFEKKHAKADKQSILDTTMDAHEQNVLDAETAYTAAYDSRMSNEYQMFAWEPVVPKEAMAAEPAIEAEPALSVDEEKGWIII